MLNCLCAFFNIMFFVGSSELRDQCEKEIDTLTSRYIDLEQEVRAQVSYHVIWFSDLADLWVIKIKSLWSFARVVHRDHVNRARKANHVARACERFVHFIVKITSLYDYQTWRRHFMRNSRGAQRYVGFFFLIVFYGADWLDEQTPNWNWNWIEICPIH